MSSGDPTPAGHWFWKSVRAEQTRAALTFPVRWRLLRWLDRPLAFLLRLEPRMLSSRARVARVPFTGTFPQLIRLWLWEKHSVQAGIILSLVVGIGMCLVALVVSRTFTVPMLGFRADIEDIPNIVLAVAAYLGGLLGFLQAVAMFAVQLRSQQDAMTLPLTPLIARRYHTFFVQGAIAGVTLTNLVAALAAPIVPVSRGALGALIWFDLFAVPGATVAALWYLAAIVAEAGEADIDVALPIIRATMRAQTHADARQVELLNAYGRCLEATGIKYAPFAGSSLRSRATTYRIAFRHAGTVSDVDCHRLNEVGRLLKSIPTLPEAAVTIAIGQTIEDESALILTWKSPATQGATPPAAPSVGDEFQKRLQSALNGAFIVRQESGA